MRPTVWLSLFAISAALCATSCRAEVAEPTVTKLANGVRVVTQPRPGTGLVAVDVWVSAGSGHERAGEAGAAHLLEHMLFRGSASVPSGGLDAATENAGGLMNAGTMRHAAHLFTEVVATGLPAVLPALADAVRAPLLDPAFVEKERDVIVDELAAAPADAAERATEQAFARLWQGSGAVGPVAGTVPGIRALPIGSLRAFHRRLYRPERTVVSIAGDVLPEAALASAQRAFGDWTVEPELGAEEAAEPGSVAALGAAICGSGCAVALPVPVAPGSLVCAELCGNWLAGRAQDAKPDGATVVWRITRAPGKAAMVLAAKGRRGSAAELKAWMAGFLASMAASPPTLAEVSRAGRLARSTRMAAEETCLGAARSLGEAVLCGDPVGEKVYDAALQAADREAIGRLLRSALLGAVYAGDSVSE